MEPLDRSLLGLTGYRMRRSTSSSLSRMSSVFAEFGLRRTTFSTLVLVVDNPGMRQSQIAEALAIERPNFVQIVDELEKAGLVERKAAVGDRRAYALQPTPAGCALLERAMIAAREIDQQMTQGLSPEQIDALHSALKIIDINAKCSETSDERQISRA
ncbi:MarR family transcriptional regulator [Planktotalea sp.]|uniref:MarR family winged helix-turn-helix transcriptional regulator n=1 Tax=Planktotalea sp. TaxID=2029877 RepID=UPI0025FC772A|nr:MarR family transcriptional regulator [Planktotalea sp.]